MKVLFAVSNEEISESIVKKYQKEYKQIISYKNVYYFNAILKELQKDKSYDRVVISEDLEAFTHTQYDQIDKFIFEKLDSISDEANNIKGNDIPIILLCSDRRTKSEEMLVKLFGIGIYNAIIGIDRSVDEVCKLIYRPRSKKEAKNYYRIEADDVNYQSENENDVSEVEIQNILAHYKRLGKNEDRYLDSFNNIAAQYNDTQLRIISKFLPLNVRAVLEEKSTKYQQVMSFNNNVSDNLRKPKKEEPGTSEKLFTPKNRPQMSERQVVIPSTINMNSNKKLARTKRTIQQISQPVTIEEPVTKNNMLHQPIMEQTGMEDFKMNQTNQNSTVTEQVINRIDTMNIENEETEKTNQVKRGRGRPRKNPIPEKTINQVKRGRGRPRKNPTLEENNQSEEELILPGLADVENNIEEEAILPGLNTIDDNQDNKEEEFLPGILDTDNIKYSSNKNEEILPNLQKNNYQSDSYKSDNYQSNNYQSNTYQSDNYVGENTISSIGTSQFRNEYNNTPIEMQQKIEKANDNYGEYDGNIESIDLSYLLTPDKKIVTFVGTSKNGTSFIVNNLAELLSSYGVNTAILDTTKNKNSYYIYTKNEENLRVVATNSIEGLANGVANGVQVNNNLAVYTSLPNDGELIKNTDKILETLLKKHSLILIDTDFDTPSGYFKQSQETYLIQSLDILTIQPLTAFLRELKAKGILEENKLRVILNKAVKIKGVNEKTIIGGMAYYNDPAMSFMTELFDRNTMRYIVIPFEQEIYVKYLESIIECNVSLRGYSKSFMQSLKELSNMVYNTSNTYRAPMAKNGMNANTFSPNINNTLNQMKKSY